MLLLVDVTFYTHIGIIRLTRFHPGSVDRNSHKGKISDVHIGQIYHCVRSGILELQCIESQIRLVRTETLSGVKQTRVVWPSSKKGCTLSR